MKAVARPWRSGWCGRTAQAWQHGHCRGAHDGGGRVCVCACHTTADLAELLEVHDVAGLVDALDGLLAQPGERPPAAHRLRVAAVELLDGLREAAVQVAAGDPTTDPVGVVEAQGQLKYDGALVVGEPERGGDGDRRDADVPSAAEACGDRAPGVVEVGVDRVAGGHAASVTGDAL